MQAAAQELSLPLDFFDRQWAQESGRGRNKTGPVLRDGERAQGDFQIKPSTQAAWERRFGKTFDANNFHDSLFMAAETMRENLAKFKDPVDATRAYNAGWDKSRWNNPETVGYVAALWPTAKTAPTAAAADWPTLPSLKQHPAKAPDISKEIGDALNASVMPQPADGIEQGRADAAGRYAAAVKEQARKEGTGVFDVGHEAERDPRVMPTWSILNWFNSEPADPSFDYMAQRETLEAGMTEDERSYMRENVTSEQTALRARAEIEYRRGLDQTYSDAGGLKAFTGQMAAGLTDPASLALGLGMVKAFQMARIGSGAMIAAGRPGAAVGSMLAENAAANVAIEGVSDAVGEVKTSGDYAMAAASGALLAAPFSRGVFRQGAEAAIREHATSIHERAVAEQSAAATRVMREEPNLTPEQVARRVEDNEADQISRAVQEATGPQRQDRVVPDDVRSEMVDEFTGVPEKVSSAKEAPDLAMDALDFEQPPIIEQLRKGSVARKVNDNGQKITLSWSLDGNKPVQHGNLRDTLDAIKTHPLASPVEKRTATYLQKVMSKDGLDMEIRFSSRDARSNYDPSGPGVAIYDPKGNMAPNDLGEKVNGLTKYGVYSVLHEVFHAATYNRIATWEKKAGLMNAEQIRIMRQFEDLFDRFKEQVDELGKVKAEHGARYSATNLHEFAAQFFTDKETRDILSVMPGKPVAGRSTSALRELMSIIKRVLGLEGRNAFDEGAKIIDQMIAMPMDNVQFKNGTPVFAPAQPKVTETPEFKTWFGKSKVVSVGGEPRPMFHGTRKSPDGEGIHSFDTYGSEYGLFGQGSYFTDSPGVASSYTKKGRGDGPTVYPVYLKIEHPINMDGPAKAAAWAKAFPEVDFEGEYKPSGNTNEAHYRQVEEWARDAEMLKYEAAEMIQDGIRQMGFDGITHIGGGRVDATGEKHRVFIAFDPEQVKSSIGNTEFDGSKPGIVQAGANPDVARRNKDTWGARMVENAKRYMALNPINQEKLNVATKWIGGVSAGLRLAASKNEIAQLVASLVAETTTGAAGRLNNVAMRMAHLHPAFVGNGMLDFNNAYAVYRGRNGGGHIEDAWHGNIKRQFNGKVYEEVLRRRHADYTPNRDLTVVEAADALEGIFERARQGQVDAGVLGWGNLPANSKGYMPQALDGAKLQAATLQDIELLHGVLARQFEERIGYDSRFSADLARKYTERVRRRAMGEEGVDGLAAGGDGLQLVRDVVEEMGGDPSLIDRARAAESTKGQGHTKKRLDIDLLAELRPGLRVMDFYETDPLKLARSYARRSAGTVALTEKGIMGIRGARELREAALHKSATPITKDELGAMDQVFAEILGTPVAGAKVSAGATNFALFVGLQRLGGLVFAQASETFNMNHNLGLRSVYNGVPELPRLLGEVGRLGKGERSNNHILRTVEPYGGEIGMESYKMIAPLDAPDAMLSGYMDQPGLLSRLLRAGGHLQSKISGFRGLMAAQHRMVAEQIVIKALRYIRDGKNDINLADMGFTPEVAESLRGDLKHITEWDSNDHLISLDLTRVSDVRTAEAFISAVRRGTGQIIQGTFIGERNAWVHNDYMRVITQLRTFGITSAEKQWGRTRMNHGYTYAAGAMLGQMALALPIYAAKVQVMAAGREDREKYIKDAMSPAALVRATMNYSSMSGFTADVLDLTAAVAGGWGGNDMKKALGVRTDAASVGRTIPAAGTIDMLGKLATGRLDLHTGIKQFPFSGLWYLQPALNLTKDN